MKQLIIAFTLILIANYNGNAQTFKYDFSDNTTQTNPNPNAVAAGDGWLVVRKKSAGKLYSIASIAEIVRYDNKMQKVLSAVIPLKSDKFFVIKGLFVAKGEYSLIYGYKNSRSDDEMQISGIRINPTDLSVKGEVGLGSIFTQGGYNILDAGTSDDRSFSFHYSIDSSRYYLMGYPQQKKKDPKQFGFVIFNPDLSKMYGRNIELDVQSRYVEIESTTLDQHGSFYVQRRTIPIEVSNSHIDKEHEKYVPEESILTHYSKDDPGSNVVLGLAGKFVYQTKIAFNRNSNKLEIAGTYKNHETGRISGVFYCHYDPGTKKTSGLVSSDIPADMMEIFTKEKLAKTKGKDPGLSLAFTIQNIGTRPNGTIDVMLEYYNAIERTSTNNNISYDFVRYYSHSILNVNIDPAGKMIFTRVPKRQTIQNESAYLSFFPLYRGNDLVLIYNDEKKNLSKDIEDMPKEIEPYERGTSLVAATIDEKGILMREVVYEHSDDKFVTLPKLSRMIPGHSVLLTKTKTGKTFSWELTKVGVLQVK